jgi:hypothetical protein
MELQFLGRLSTLKCCIPFVVDLKQRHEIPGFEPLPFESSTRRGLIEEAVTLAVDNFKNVMLRHVFGSRPLRRIAVVLTKTIR